MDSGLKITGLVILFLYIWCDRVIGAVFIVAGLYIVLWGKGEETKTVGLTENTENEARIDIPPQVEQSDATNRAEAEAGAEAEERTESVLPQNNNIDNRSCIEEMDVESQNKSSSSSRDEETRLEMELLMPSEEQSECIHSGGNNETVVVEEMQKHLHMQKDSKSSSSSSNSRNERAMEEQMKEVLKEMEARMAGKLEARLVADKAKMPPPPPPPPPPS